MKLIINIPDEVYKDGAFLDYFRVMSSELVETIYNGIPLPKGHGNLYDERDLEKLGNVYFQEEVITNDRNIELHLPKLIINATPIIEADKEINNETCN